VQHIPLRILRFYFFLAMKVILLMIINPL
jgi:hypothetical protein